MKNLIEKDIIQELTEKQVTSIKGGGPILEGLAWWAGFVNALYEASHKNQTEEEYWNEARVLYGG